MDDEPSEVGTRSLRTYGCCGTEQSPRRANSEGSSVRYGFEAHPEGDEVHIRLWGEVDVYCALEVEERLLQAFDLGPGRVRLDLQGIRSMDSHGFWLMSRIARRLCNERRPASCTTNQRMATLFRMAGLAPTLNVTAAE